jgi:hypothetical protein
MIFYLSTLVTRNELLSLRMRHHVISQPVLAQHFFAAQLTHKHLAHHVGHLPVDFELVNVGETLAALLARLFEYFLVHHADMRSQGHLSEKKIEVL